MSKAIKHPIAVPTPEEDEAINASALSDPDALPLTPDQLNAMVPMHALRDRPPSASKKQLVSIRYSAEVVEFFKGTGDGWQSRMDDVLRDYVLRQSRRRGT